MFFIYLFFFINKRYIDKLIEIVIVLGRIQSAGIKRYTKIGDPISRNTTYVNGWYSKIDRQGSKVG